MIDKESSCLLESRDPDLLASYAPLVKNADEQFLNSESKEPTLLPERKASVLLIACTSNSRARTFHVGIWLLLNHCWVEKRPKRDRHFSILVSKCNPKTTFRTRTLTYAFVRQGGCGAGCFVLWFGCVDGVVTEYWVGMIDSFDVTHSEKQ